MDTSSKIVGFMPWLELSKAIRVGDFSFVPYLDNSGIVAPQLTGLKNALPAILSSYFDTQQRPVQNCVVVIDESGPDPGNLWNLSPERINDIRQASSLLFLAAWAANEYFIPIRSYVNETFFQLFFQRFSEPVDFISLGFRQRDGQVLAGGQKHGEIHFAMPLQCDSEFGVDGLFLTALNAADVVNSELMKRLRGVLPFVRLANTDSDAMSLDTEAALMGFAFEQYFGATNARDLATKFDDSFKAYGRSPVRSVKAARRGIYVDPRYPAQFDWPITKMWMFEFHQYRSAVVHGSVDSRTWGWSPFEHLVMAAFVFPLAVKLHLVREGNYSFSREDEIRCLAIDGLLSIGNWRGKAGSMQSPWQDVIRMKRSETRIAAAVSRAVEELRAKGITPPDIN